MADTKNDVTIPSANWVNAHTIASITATDAIQIFNKSSWPILLQIIAAQPADADVNGIVVSSIDTNYANVEIPSSQSGVWVKALQFDAVANISPA